MSIRRPRTAATFEQMGIAAAMREQIAILPWHDDSDKQLLNNIVHSFQNGTDWHGKPKANVFAEDVIKGRYDQRAQDTLDAIRERYKLDDEYKKYLRHVGPHETFENNVLEPMELAPDGFDQAYTTYLRRVPVHSRFDKVVQAMEVMPNRDRELFLTAEPQLRQLVPSMGTRLVYDSGASSSADMSGRGFKSKKRRQTEMMSEGGGSSILSIPGGTWHSQGSTWDSRDSASGRRY